MNFEDLLHFGKKNFLILKILSKFASFQMSDANII